MDWPCQAGNLVIMADQIQKYYGSITAEILIASFASLTGTGDNHLCWYDLTNQIIYVSFAAPFAVSGSPNAFDRQFTAFDLNVLFRCSKAQ